MDTGATDHITGELEKLTIRDKYSGNEQVHAANGTGMEIGYVGHSVLHSPRTHIHLNNVLHVPQASKSLISINRLARDNNVFSGISSKSLFHQGTGDQEDSPARQM